MGRLESTKALLTWPIPSSTAAKTGCPAERRHQRITVAAGAGLGDANLLQPRWLQADNRALRDIAAKLLEPFDSPRRDRAGQPSYRDPVMLHEFGRKRHRIEKAKPAFEDRADLVTCLQHIDRLFLHQLLQTLGERGFAAADRAQQIDDLLALLVPVQRGGRSRQFARSSPPCRRSRRTRGTP